MGHSAFAAASRRFSALKFSALAAASLFSLVQAAAAAEERDAPKGAAVTVLKAAKSCFDDTVEVSGLVLARDETAVRPDRPALKVAEVLVDPGDTVKAGQNLARLTAPDGGSTMIQTPVAGTIATSSATIGAFASGRGEALFTIIARNEYDLVGLVPSAEIGKVAANQSARLHIVGAGDFDGSIRRVAPTIEPNSQLGQAFIGINSDQRLLINSFGRAVIKIGQSCGIAVPLTAVLYDPAGTVVQVVKQQRVETKVVEVGLMAGGQVEIRSGLNEGDVVVARAGALLREGDPVRPIMAGAEAAASK
ncbi:efflux RND transporter periplasmic adaptor subunit [Bradyrhizobium sp. SZCCHNR2026]|uniref:efflux RND transporter periplasmic adaptor subunit n=1 Tax=Bradyrhizobium sp. SZCCHNR2026 TaxID=3057381 RepID=UPI002916FAEE|nr:efflux RND transporter periplasmic adaptor subunit [Bradyrhizobium sp. SZCCHNR2026]